MPKKSSRPFATNKQRREAYALKGALDKRPILFIDRAIQGRKLIDALKAEGANFELHQDHFPNDSPDTTWLPEVGKRGWCVITRDKAIQKNPLERRAVMNARVGFFVLSTPQSDGQETADIIIGNLPQIEKIALSRDKPFIARITRDGVKLVVEKEPPKATGKTATDVPQPRKGQTDDGTNEE